MNLTLRTHAVDGATVGALTVGSLALCTIEPSWRDNRHDISCVPAGTYQLIPYVSPKHGQTWRLHNPALGIWGLNDDAPAGMRTEVELHSLNFARESEGCIGVGLSAEPMLDPIENAVVPAIQDSVIAFAKLRALLDGTSEEDLLTIVRS